jgi:hypothetical protein
LHLYPELYNLVENKHANNLIDFVMVKKKQ